MELSKAEIVQNFKSVAHQENPILQHCSFFDISYAISASLMLMLISRLIP
jgi:hypothetical protein